MKLKKFLVPTVPKIMLYAAFFFVSPTFFRTCTTETCDYNIKFLAGLKLAQQTPSELTLPMLILLFLISYLISCLIVSGFNYLKEKRMTLS